MAGDDALFASYFWWRNFYTVTDDASLEAQYWYLYYLFFFFKYEPLLLSIIGSGVAYVIFYGDRTGRLGAQ